MSLRTRTAVAATVAAGIGLTAATAGAIIAPGTPARDVHVGLDNDNADNPFIQPPGVAAKQHMDNTDVVFGRGENDLLIGRLGGDTLVAGPDDDILVGGPERGTSPNSDVLLGDKGDDINVWAPGDGSDAFVGDKGYDTSVFASFLTNPDGSLVLERSHRRLVPRVDIGGKPQFRCDIVPVPASEQLGAQFLVRFLVNDTIVVTVRHKDAERVLCPSPYVGKAAVAYLTDPHPAFRNVRLDRIGGTLGAIVAAP